MTRWRCPLPAVALVPLVCLAFVACAKDKGTVDNGLVPDYRGNAGGASGQSCEYDGKTYEAGESFPVDCNRCTCQPGGGWGCTLILCPGDGGAAGANDGEAGTGGVATGEAGAAATTGQGGAGR